MSKHKEQVIRSEEQLFKKVKRGFLDYDPAHYVEQLWLER
jgi:hypothetical protein